MISDTLNRIKIVPVLVLDSVDAGLRMCETLYANGLAAAEITFRTAAAEGVIRPPFAPAFRNLFEAHKSV